MHINFFATNTYITFEFHNSTLFRLSAKLDQRPSLRASLSSNTWSLYCQAWRNFEIYTEAYSNVRVYTDISLICNDATWRFPTTEVKGATIQADV